MLTWMIDLPRHLTLINISKCMKVLIEHNYVHAQNCTSSVNSSVNDFIFPLSMGNIPCSREQKVTQSVLIMIQYMSSDAPIIGSAIGIGR